MGVFDFILKPIQNLLGEVLGFLTGADFDEQDQASGVLVNKQSNIDPIPVVYGRRKVGGVRAFISTGGGTKNEYLYIALVLSEGQIDAVEEIYINDTISTDSKYSGLVSTQVFLGSDDQTYSTLLAGADSTWGANHRLRGVAYLAIRLKYDQDVFGGIPDIQCVIRGKRIYDPRKDSTSSVYDSGLGVSSHRSDDPTTWQWSNNPALCLRDYLTNARYGKGLNESLIDESSFATSADFLESKETQHTTPITVDGNYPAGSTSINLAGNFTWIQIGNWLQFAGSNDIFQVGGSIYGAGSITLEDATTFALTNGQSVDTIQNIYECNAVIDTGNKLFENVKTMLQGMRGLMPFSNGVYSLIIDRDVASTFDLTPDNITSDITVQTQGKDKKYNRVTVKFTNPDANWQSDSVIYPEAGSAEETQFLSQDNGEELAKTVTMNTITNKYSAKDIAKIICLASRQNELTVKVTATSEALEIAVADVVRLEHPSMGWIDDGVTDARKKFRVVGMQLKEDGEVDLTLQEYNNGIYPWVTGDEIDSGVDTILPDPFDVAPPTNLNAVETTVIESDGTVLPAMKVTWTAADDAFVDEYEVQLDNTTSSTKQNFFTSATELLISPIRVGQSYTVSVRSINSIGSRSAFVVYNFGTASGDTTAPGVPTGTSADGGFKQITVSWTNPTDSDFKHVKLQVSTNGSTWTDLGVSDSESFVHYIDGFGITRYYRVASVDFSDNVSAYTSSFIGTTDFVDADSFTQNVEDLFANANVKQVDVVSTLPASGAYTGQVVFLTTDNKLYRWTGSAWTAAVPTSDLTGTITETQITDGAISTPKLDANAVTANKIAGNTITGDKIVANTITGGLLATAGIITTAAQITDAVITNAKIENGAITTAKIGDLQVETIKIKDNAVTIPEGVDASHNGNIGTTFTELTNNGSSARVSISWPSGERPEAVICGAFAGFKGENVAGTSAAEGTGQIRIRAEGGQGSVFQITPTVGNSFLAGFGGDITTLGHFALTTQTSPMEFYVECNMSTAAATREVEGWGLFVLGAKK